MTDIEADNPMEANERIAQWKIRQLTAEIVRLRIKLGEPITVDEITSGFARPDGNCFNIKRSANYR